MGDKTPKANARRRKQRRAAAVTDTGRKRAVVSPAADSSYELPFRFRFNRVDVGSDWCLTLITREDHLALIDFMAQMERLSLGEVIPAIGKREDVAGNSPNPLAQRRAQEKFPDDHDQIHSLRVSGSKRIWGLQFANEFSVIWWDPGHEIWPTQRVYGN